MRPLKLLKVLTIGFGLILGFLLIASVVTAEDKKDEIQKAPSFPRKGQWLNSQTQPKDIFKNKITLVYFWDYTSINAIRELDYLKQWHEHYAEYGLEIIMVHAPEFEFAKNKTNVEEALKRFQIPFPVFLDNDFKLWEKYQTRTWPTKFLVDSKKRIVHRQGGEIGYFQMEEEIRKALLQLRPDIFLPPPYIVFDMDPFSLDQCGDMSPETYTGFARATWWGAENATKRSVLPDQTLRFLDRGNRAERGFFVQGLWTNRKDYFEHARDTGGMNDYLGMIYQAHEVYAVMNAIGEELPGRVYVTRDDQPIPLEMRGKDLKVDEMGNTFLDVREPRLYYLISREDPLPHEIKLWTTSKGTGINSFSFSNRCLADFEHL